MVICLERDADLHMARLMPLPLTVSCFGRIQIGLLFWCRLTRVVPEKGPLKGCVCVCVCVCARALLLYIMKYIVMLDWRKEKRQKNPRTFGNLAQVVIGTGK